jgi:hypothetical protein
MTEDQRLTAPLRASGIDPQMLLQALTTEHVTLQTAARPASPTATAARRGT